MKLIYLKSALKCDCFDVTIGIKIPFFKVLVTIELGRSLLLFVPTKLSDLGCSSDEMMRDMLVFNVKSGRIRERLSSED